MNIEKEQERKELQKTILLYPKERIDVKLTQEQLELLLQNHERELRKIDWKGFIGIFALFAAILITVMTADFRDFLGLSGETIRGFFVLVAFVSGVCSAYLFIRNIYYSFRNKPQSAHNLIEEKVNEMREQMEETTEEAYASFKPTIFEWNEMRIRQKPRTRITRIK